MEDLSLYGAMAAYIAENRFRLHTPGHKGRLPAPLDGAALWDLTELPQTDSLYAPSGPLAALAEGYARVYRAGRTLLSAGGATLGIQAMLAAFCPPGSAVLMGRNAHLSAVNAMALMDLRPLWLYPDEPAGPLLPGRVSPAAIKEALKAHPRVSALYLTSPDYHGVLCDIGAASALCREAGVPLLVDNAHGAHLFPFGLHPMALGADACVDSLHKTLPALTGAALVHLSDPDMERTALERMGMFGSTSPSFLILLSMDRLLPRLESELPDRLNALAREVAGLRLKAQAQGLWGTAGLCDPCRLCLCHAALEMGKEDFYAGLRQAGIEPEYLSESHCVLLPDIRGEALTAVSDWLKSLPTGAPIKNMPPPPRAEAVMTPRQAAFAPSRQIDVDEAEGRVAARAESPCPPGLPLVMPGERIDLNVKKILKTAGTERVSVVE